MKRVGIVCSLIVLLSRAALAQTISAGDHRDDDAAIKRVLARNAEYWNRHEFARRAELYTEDSEIVNVVGQRRFGSSPPRLRAADEPRQGASCDQLDPNTVTRRLGERSVAGDDRRLHRLRKSDVYGVVCTHVVS